MFIESSIKEIKMVHAKLADETQNTQSTEYKYIYFAVFALKLSGLCMK